MTGYNGWENYKTWNVALWLQNEEGYYQIALSCGSPYERFIPLLNWWTLLNTGELDGRTPDGVKWDDEEVNVEEINEMLLELND